MVARLPHVTRPSLISEDLQHAAKLVADLALHEVENSVRRRIQADHGIRAQPVEQEPVDPRHGKSDLRVNSGAKSTTSDLTAQNRDVSIAFHAPSADSAETETSKRDAADSWNLQAHVEVFVVFIAREAAAEEATWDRHDEGVEVDPVQEPVGKFEVTAAVAGH